MFLKKMYITNNPEIAVIAENNGVDYIWIDLEIEGKEERQKGRNTVISNHSVSDISVVKKVLQKSELIVRINPWSKNSCEEVEKVIEAGADIVMLPMWRTVEEVSSFLECINGRVKTILLLETIEAIQVVDDILKYENVDEIFIGLNDLNISRKKTFLFEALADGTVEFLCKKFIDNGINYGFGGIAKIGDGLLPAEKIIAEHYRLGSTRVILSRTFCDNAKTNNIDEIRRVFEINMMKINEYENFIEHQNSNFFENNKKEVKDIVDNVVQFMKER